ncbi:MAG: nucleosidase [Alphaproteobacteria bacterium]|nr:nucleosidase [Alphaproteobacteria bacterium]
MNKAVSKRPLLVFAMKEESQEVFSEYGVLHTGIGKVNAAHALTKYLAAHTPSMVVNLGTAGSRKHSGGAIVNPTVFVQRDMDVTFLGFEKFQTPFSDDPVFLGHGIALEDFPQGICGSGDNFDTSDGALAFDAVDMEAYALALICQREGVPFLCLKYISDGADGEAGTDWKEALHHTAERLLAALKNAGL